MEDTLENPDAPLYEYGGLITCKYCKTSNLYWGKTELGWRLFDHRGKQHICTNSRKVTSDGRLYTRHPQV